MTHQVIYSNYSIILVSYMAAAEDSTSPFATKLCTTVKKLCSLIEARS